MVYFRQGHKNRSPVSINLFLRGQHCTASCLKAYTVPLDSFKTSICNTKRQRQYCVPQSIQSASLSNHSRPNWRIGGAPSPDSECYCPPRLTRLVPGGHTRLRERGRGEPIRTEGQTLWYSRYTIILLYCVLTNACSKESPFSDV